MKQLIQWSIDHHWIVIALSVSAVGGDLDRARHAGRRLPRPHRADGDGPHRGARHGAGGGRVAGHVPDRDRDERRARACGACAPPRPSASPSCGSSSTGAPTSTSRARSSPRSSRSWRARCPRRSSGRCSPRSRRSWARSCSSRCRRRAVDPLTLRTARRSVVRRRLLAVAGRLAGHADRRRRAAVPGPRPPRALRANGVSLTELLDAVARRQRERLGGRLRRGAAGIRAPGGRPRADRRGDRRQRRRAARATVPC